MTILITGSAGFIGSALTLELLKKGNEIVGVDNHNHYYDPALKEARLARHLDHNNYTHRRLNIADRKKMVQLFSNHQFDVVINLAAQAGVRYSLENPLAYIDANLVGFGNILEGCRHNEVKHLIYASSSSVYGANTKTPFATTDSVNHPVSLYAATKKANELMAHTYSHLYNLPTTGLRFFTVYGPWDRPDMALQKFTKAILAGEEISVFNYGKHRRDFTYIDDIVAGVIKVLGKPPKPDVHWQSEQPRMNTSNAPWRIYNIGNNKPIALMDYIGVLEAALGVKAKKKLLPQQAGDMLETYADIDDLVQDFNYQTTTSIEQGIKNFVHWYQKFYG